MAKKTKKAKKKAGGKKPAKAGAKRGGKAKGGTRGKARAGASKKSAGKQKTGGKQAKRAAKAKSAPSGGPHPVTTGKGPNPLDVATKVAALLRAGNAAEVEEQWLAPAIESVEGVGASLAWNGKPAVLGKYRAWEADHEIHELDLEGPWVGATGFALKYRIDVSQKSTGQRTTMEEIAVYTVRDGKITREEFHFALPG